MRIAALRPVVGELLPGGAAPGSESAHAISLRLPQGQPAADADAQAEGTRIVAQTVSTGRRLMAFPFHHVAKRASAKDTLRKTVEARVHSGGVVTRATMTSAIIIHRTRCVARVGRRMMRRRRISGVVTAAALTLAIGLRSTRCATRAGELIRI